MLSQHRLQSYLDHGRSAYRAAAYEAPPAPLDAPMGVNQDLHGLPSPFPAPLVVKTTEVKMEGEPCAKCFKPLGVSERMRPVMCDLCREYWHLKCARLDMTPMFGWTCPRCR